LLPDMKTLAMTSFVGSKTATITAHRQTATEKDLKHR